MHTKNDNVLSLRRIIKWRISLRKIILGITEKFREDLVIMLHKYTIKGTVYGSLSSNDNTEHVVSRDLVNEFEEIRSLFKEGEDDNLALYIDSESSLSEAISDIWVDIKIINNDLFSWTEVFSNRKLTELEEAELLDYLCGQFSDGYGEGLEQREYAESTFEECSEEWDELNQEYYMSYYDVTQYSYFHLWNHDGFCINIVSIEEVPEMDAYLPFRPGSTRPPEVVKVLSRKPKCKLVGTDGNIFALLGTASKALNSVGRNELAKEMRDRVTSSHSYSEALAIICEYVEAY